MISISQKTHDNKNNGNSKLNTLCAKSTKVITTPQRKCLCYDSVTNINKRMGLNYHISANDDNYKLSSKSTSGYMKQKLLSVYVWAI